jgi:hypothetical protein
MIFENLGRIAPRDCGVAFSGSHVIASEAKQSIVTSHMERWIASRSLSSGAHSRDPVARNDGPLTRNNSQQIAAASEWR